MRESFKGLGIFLGILLVAGIIGAVIWGTQVTLSGPKGVGDAIMTKNSSANWTKEQAAFENLHADIIAADRKVTLAYASYEEDKTDKTARQTYEGIRSGCVNLVSDYNAKARSYLAEEFRSADLPAQIDDSSKNTDCKE